MSRDTQIDGSLPLAGAGQRVMNGATRVHFIAVDMVGIVPEMIPLFWPMQQVHHLYI